MTTGTQLRTSGQAAVQAADVAIHRGSAEDIHAAIDALIAEGREFTTKMHERVVHESFESFVEAKPLAGIGTTVTTLKRICSASPAALDALDKAVQIVPGQHRPAASNVSSSQGNAATQALRRLRKDAPELHAEVLAGNLSAHAAMVQAGYRPRTITVRLDDPLRTAGSLLRNAPDQKYVQDLIDALKAGEVA